MTTLDYSFFHYIHAHFQLPLNEANRDDFFSVCEKRVENSDEIEALFELFKAPKTAVFIGWINSDSVLKNVLLQPNITQKFSDTNKWNEHALFHEFQRFISPFLYAILVNNLKQKGLKISVEALSFSLLLCPDEQCRIQDQISSLLLENLEDHSAKVVGLKSEGELHHFTQAFFTNKKIETLSLLDNEHYQIKRKILDFFINLSKHPKSSTRFASFLVQTLLQINFSKEHTLQLIEFNQSLKSGKFHVEKTKKPWGKILVFLLIGIAITTLITMLFLFAPAKKNTIEQEQTAFMQLTPTERKQLDSLFENTKKKQKQQLQSIDNDMPFVGEELKHATTFENNEIEFLINTWKASDTTTQIAKFSKSDSYSKNYPHSRILRSKPGLNTVMFLNTSKSMVLIIVYRNKEKQWHSKYVPASQSTTWRMSTEDFMFVLPGNKVNQNQKFGDLPFKEVNSSFYENLTRHYRFAKDIKSIKLVWKEESNTFYLVDLSNSLIVEQ